MESVACGVPILGCPRFADQTTKCHYVTQVWGIGLCMAELETCGGWDECDSTEGLSGPEGEEDDGPGRRNGAGG